MLCPVAGAMGAICCAQDSGSPVELVAGDGPKDKVCQVTIIGARGLRSADSPPGNGASGSYCVCEIPGKSGSKVKTPVCQDSVEPVWNFEAVLSSYQPGDALCFTLFDNGTASSDDHLGKAQLSALRLQDGFFDGELPLAAEAATTTGVLKLKVCTVPRPAKKKKPKQKPLPETETNEETESGGCDMRRCGEVTVTLMKDSEFQPLGLSLEMLDSAVGIVTNISTGAIESHNGNAKECEQVRIGDIILEVNGISGDAAGMVEELKSDKKSHQLVFMHPETFTIVIDKNPSLGVQFTGCIGSSSVVISKISKGSVQDWNETHQDAVVKPYDRVHSVNGVSGSARELLEQIQLHDRLEMVISRAPS